MAAPRKAMTADGEMTIDELARETGMTVRNIRAHQSRGLLPPPEVRARTGFYGPAHAARLRTIQDMQAQGFNLRGIERLLSSSVAGDEMLNFGRTVIGAFAEESPEYITAEELVERVGYSDPRHLREAVKLDLVRPLGDGRYEVPSPTLLRAGESLLALGVPASHALAVGAKVRRMTTAIAENFVRLFTEDVIGDRDVRSLDQAEWAKIGEALERLRPLAAEVVAASFSARLAAAVEAEVQKRIGG